MPQPEQTDEPVLSERLQELLNRIKELSDEELDELRDLIQAQFDGMQSDPERVHGVDSAAEMNALAAAITKTKTEYDRRKALRNQRDRIDSTLAAIVPEDRRPRWHLSRGAAANRVVTASGQELSDSESVVREFVEALKRLPRDRPERMDGHKVVVATLHADRPHDRTLRYRDSPEKITHALTAAAHDHADDHRRAITAAGGFGAPEQSDYELPGFESKDRPVKAALPSFTVERGGIRFVKPPTLADVNGALGIWNVAMDIDAATNTAVRKPALRVMPNNEVVVDVQAITNTLVFGNMMTMAYPEYVQRVVDLTMAAHARIAEQQLLTQIGFLSTSVTGAPQPAEGRLGATRILLPLLDRAATAMRNRLRTGSDTVLQLILPDWARGILRSDLALQEPGDSTLGVTDADLAAYFSSRYLAPTWAMDGETGQHFNAQAPGAVNAWPDRIVSYMFPAGAHQFLDGGTLDIGMVRDSVLNAANDYMMFSETFETVAYRGGESLRISQPVTPSGIARAAETTT